MPDTFSDEQWAVILKIVRESHDLPKPDRQRFIEQSAGDERMAQEALRLSEDPDAPESDEAKQLTTFVGRFQLLEFLGSGGAGKVYSARDPDLRRTVAVKILRPNTYAERDLEQRFVREARAASALNHPNIVTIHEIIHSESGMAIVMELIAGESLRSRCGLPTAFGVLADIGRQVASGLAAAHTAGVIHRDIKPENIMVLPDGRVKVLDFGLAHYSVPSSVSTVTLTQGTLKGTPRYMSPEHFLQVRLTAAADIFALGVVFYELAAGRHPFERDSPMQVMRAIASEEAPPISGLVNGITPEFEFLIAAMMRKDPSARPAASEVEEKLRQLSLPETAPISVINNAATRWRLNIVALVTLLSIAAAVLIWKIAPSKGGFDRGDQITSLIPENHATAAAISPNGKFLAYANVDGIFVRTLGTEEVGLLKGPSDFIADRICWLAGDTSLIASGLSNNSRTSIWILRLAGGAPRELRTGGRLGAASPDGAHIAFIQDDYSAIWTMEADGGDPKRLISGPGTDIFLSVVWSGEGRHLIYQRGTHFGAQETGYVSFADRYHNSLEVASADTGAISDRLPSFSMRSAIAPRTGELIFLSGPRPGTDGIHNLWSTGVDPKTGRFSRRYRQIKTAIDQFPLSFDISISKDGSRLAIIAQRFRESVFAADFNKAVLHFENVREVTLDRLSSYPHTWTADSKSIIFESNRSGGYDLFRQALDERVPEPIVTTPKRWEVLPQLAPDGHSVLYAAGPPEGGNTPLTLMRVAVDGGSTAAVVGGDALEDFRCSVGRRGRCVMKKSLDHTWFVYFEVDPIRGVGRELTRTKWTPYLLTDWDISPDGNFVAVPNHDLRSARIRIVPLAGGATREREFELPDIANISSVVWAADQSGWFVSKDSYSLAGRRMYFFGMDERLSSLGAIYGWAVPAPDHKKVAYVDRLYEANAWILNRN